jgi:hypothetical protein
MGDLGLELRVNGRQLAPVAVSHIRNLTIADLAQLDAPRAVATPLLKRLRDSHHSLARLTAEGRSNAEISAITGCNQTRLTILKDDPAFAELVEFYRRQKQEILSDVDLRMAELLKDTVGELAERLETDSDAFSIAELQDQVKLLADRTGHGPSSKQQIDVRFGIADRLQAARERLSRAPTLELEAQGAEGARSPDGGAA